MSAVADGFELAGTSWENTVAELGCRNLLSMVNQLLIGPKSAGDFRCGLFNIDYKSE